MRALIEEETNISRKKHLLWNYTYICKNTEQLWLLWSCFSNQ